MPASCIMIQGTTSSAGKSLLTTALCRILRRRGLRVAPFKAQNMALNSFVTPDGGEIGRAQAVQAEAAQTPPRVEMNPILLKPEGNSRSQVVLLGKVLGSLSAREYHDYKPKLRRVVADSLATLRDSFDAVVIEGAGSPAEINLKENEIVNMFVAKTADAPVLLVGDIDRGGVFAAFVGTLELLEPDERARIAAFVVNKFRGDLSLLKGGLDFLTRRTGVPVMGVVPYIAGLRIADEDSVSLDDRRSGREQAGAIEIAVIRLPRISNFDDFLPLEHEPGVRLRFIQEPGPIATAGLVILPGSKCTADDLKWLRQCGFSDAILKRAAEKRPILGICGGCQMLGRRIDDPAGVESAERSVEGLGLLPLLTRFQSQKTTAQVKARAASGSFLSNENQRPFAAYEIHMGHVERLDGAAPAFEILSRNGDDSSIPDGAVSTNGAVVGTMLHGLFENDDVRAMLLESLRSRGHASNSSPSVWDKDAEYDRLADSVSASLDMPLLYTLGRW